MSVRLNKNFKKASSKKADEKKAVTNKVTKVAPKKKVTKKDTTKTRVSFEQAEGVLVNLVGVKLKAETSKGKVIKVGNNGSITLVSIPSRAEFKIKINNKVICEIYPRAVGYAFCTRVATLLKLPKDVEVTVHDKWDMFEKFVVSEKQLEGVIKQFTKLTVTRVKD